MRRPVGGETSTPPDQPISALALARVRGDDAEVPYVLPDRDVYSFLARS